MTSPVGATSATVTNNAGAISSKLDNMSVGDFKELSAAVHQKENSLDPQQMSFGSSEGSGSNVGDTGETGQSDGLGDMIKQILQLLTGKSDEGEQSQGGASSDGAQSDQAGGIMGMLKQLLQLLSGAQGGAQGGGDASESSSRSE